jgi:hypothetical protein
MNKAVKEKAGYPLISGSTLFRSIDCRNKWRSCRLLNPLVFDPAQYEWHHLLLSHLLGSISILVFITQRSALLTVYLGAAR